MSGKVSKPRKKAKLMLEFQVQFLWTFYGVGSSGEWICERASSQNGEDKGWEGKTTDTNQLNDCLALLSSRINPNMATKTKGAKW